MAAATSDERSVEPRQEALHEPNVETVVFGDVLIKPWYPSFYPKELIGRKPDRLHVCKWCFKYSVEALLYATHVKICPSKNATPPGTLIYEESEISIYEVDGDSYKLYAQNLSLFSKLFLDTKSVFYDVTSFDYYTMCKVDDSGARQVVGFFSKEKMSWDNNNVACILIFPPWQRQGLGQLLIGISYELGRLEGRRGGPEKPLSALGKKGYGNYWCATVCRSVLKSKAKRISMEYIVEDTFMLAEDVIATLHMLGAVREGQRANGDFVLDHACFKTWAAAHEKLMDIVVSAKAFVAARDSAALA